MSQNTLSVVGISQMIDQNTDNFMILFNSLFFEYNVTQVSSGKGMVIPKLLLDLSFDYKCSD